jgi:hypothetical protein
MSIYDDQIQAIWANPDLTIAEKRSQTASVRRQAVKSLFSNLPISFTQGNFTVTCLDAGLVDGWLHLKLSCKYQGKEIITDPDFYFNAPPLLVLDPNGTIVRTWTDPDGVQQQATYTEDINASMKQMVIQAIRNHTGR